MKLRCIPVAGSHGDHDADSNCWGDEERSSGPGTLGASQGDDTDDTCQLPYPAGLEAKSTAGPFSYVSQSVFFLA